MIGIRITLWILAFGLSLNAHAASVGEEIYAKATPKQRCQIEVLQKKLGLQLKLGPPAKPKNYQTSNACDYLKLSDAQAAGEMDINIQNADQFLASLDSWMSSYAATCGFKYRVSSVAKKSVDALQSGMKNNFIKEEDIGRKLCYATGSSATNVKPDTQGAYCLAAAFNATLFVECFRKGDCYADCAVGAQAAELNLMYDVYDENGDGVLNGHERELFDLAYAPSEAVVGPWHLKSPDGKPAGIYATDNPFRGKNAKDVSFISYGTQNFTGIPFHLSAKGSYADQVTSGQIQRPGGWANLTQNGIIVSVPPAAVNDVYQNMIEQHQNPQAAAQDVLFTAFEKEYAGLRENLMKLSYSIPDSSGRPTANRAYEQFLFDDHYAAIMNGTYVFKNQTPGDAAIIEEIKQTLRRPIFYQTEVYVHPYGRVTLAQLMLKMVNSHSDANASFQTYRSSINTLQFEKYRDVYVQDCLK